MNDLRESLKAYLDGELSAEERAQVEQAIQNDPVLQQEVNELKHVGSLIRQIGEAKQYSPAGAEKAMSAVREGKRAWFGPRIWVIAGSLVIVMALISPGLRSGRGFRLSQPEMDVAQIPKMDSSTEAQAGESAETPAQGVPADGFQDTSRKGRTPAEEFNGTISKTPSAHTLMDNDRSSLSFQQKLVRTASLSLKVKSVADSLASVTQIVKGLGGYVESNSIHRDSRERPFGEVVLRVPVRSFDQILDKSRGLGEVLSDTSSSEDVTAQMADIHARLKVMKAEEESYVTMLRAARRVGELLEIKDRLSSVRQEIESLEAQQRVFSDQTSYSTVTVTFTQNSEVGVPKPPKNWSDESWANAVNGLQGALRFVGEGVINIFVFSPLWVPPLLIGWWIARRSKKSQK